MIRKNLSLFLCILLLLALFGAAVSESQSPQFEYRLEEGKAHITRVTPDEQSELTFPDEIDGYEVAGIDSWALYDGNYTTINLPKSLKVMAFDAIMNQNRQKAFHIAPDNQNFTCMDGVLFQKNEDGMLALHAYPQGKQAESYQIPVKVVSILPRAFSFNSGLKTLILNEGLASIGKEAFYFSSIQQLLIPASLKETDQGAFSEMRELKNIGLDEGNTAFNIKDNALLSADGKRLLVLPKLAGNTSFDVPAGVESIDDAAFAENPTISRITLPEGLISIGNRAFAELGNLNREIILPSTLKHIGNAAFQGYKPDSITLPDGLETMDDNIFSGSNLVKIEVPDTVTKLGATAFAGSEALQEVKLSSNLSSLYWGLFHGCIALKEVIIPSGVQAIDSKVFGGCKDVVIHVPDSLIQVTPLAFDNMWTDEPVDFSSFTFAGDENSPAKSIAEELGINYVVDTSKRYVPPKADGIYTSPDGMFEYILEDNQATIKFIWNPENKKKIEIPSSIEGYPVVALGQKQNKDDEWVSSSMASNSKCRELVLPEGLKRINLAALANAPIEKITLPDSLASIAEMAFSGSNIKALDLPQDLETLEPGALSYMHKLNKLTVKGLEKPDDINEKTRFFVVDSLLYEFNQKDKGITALLCLPGKTGTVNVQPGTTHIVSAAFGNCEKITKVVLPDTLVEIGEEAFAWCYKLSSINLPAGVKILPKRVFHMTGLTKIDLPEGLTEIGEQAFYATGKLKAVLLPASLSSIGRMAFSENGLTAFELAEGNQHFKVVDGVLFSQDMKTLVEYPCMSKAKEYTVPDGVTQMSDGVFSNCKNLIKVNLPEGITEIPYGAFSGNGKTKLAVSFPSTLTAIGDAAFNKLNFGNDLVLPVGIKYIGEMAFDQSSFKTLTLPEGLTGIGRWSFRWNPVLTTITLPSTLTEIPEGAFEGNKKLTEIIGAEHLKQVHESAFQDCPKLKTKLPGR